MKPIRREFTYGDNKVTLETGRIAKQADAAVLVTMNETTLLCTVVGAHSARSGQSFFPLTVNYQEKAYAAGRIPGSFFRREGRPSEQEILISRLIDRSIRPLFAKGFMNEVQVVCTLLSADLETPTDIPALLGAAGALALSGLPFNGPIAGARVGLKDNLYVLNPSNPQLEESSLDMVVSGTKEATLMVESGASELPEDIVLGALLFAQEALAEPLEAISSLAAECGKPRWSYKEPEDNPIITEVEAAYADRIKKCCEVTDKAERKKALSALKSDLIEDMAEVHPEALGTAFESLHKKLMRNNILDQQVRPDGRDTTTVRPITVEAPVLAKTHGSALFTRGETQALVTTTLGSLKDAALIDAITGKYFEPFLLHYNFPPYSVGETGMMIGPKRREIGHGHLARRAIIKMLPNQEDFPYTIRLVSEITESNGSSSMATVCGASLSLMDAGVPIKNAVAGVAMGLILDKEDHFAVLTDIIGDEDHLGDMDFKVAGTKNGITALQMDIKVTGITHEIMEKALEQAKIARMHILQTMDDLLDKPRSQLSSNAPSFEIIQIPVDKIRELIGSKGSTIKQLTEDTGSNIDVAQDGKVKIYADTRAMVEATLERIKIIVSDPEIGTLYKGTVKNIVDFGAFVEIMPGKEGLLHVSEITGERIEKISDYLTEGQEVEVVVLSIDHQKRIKLSMKKANQGDQSEDGDKEQGESEVESAPEANHPLPEVGDICHGTVKHIENYGGFIEIAPGIQGLVHRSEIAADDWVENVEDHLHLDQEVKVKVVSIKESQGKTKISLSMKQAAPEAEEEEEDPEEVLEV